MRRIIVTGIIALAVALVSCVTETEAEPVRQEPQPPGREIVTVLRVIDGDTIEVRLANSSGDTVRYIGVDTPETVAPGQPVETCGPEASELNKSLLSMGAVLLEKDISERDRYGRLLRYVYVRTGSGQLTFVNEELVRAGLAAVSTFPPDVKYAEQLLAARRAVPADVSCSEPEREPPPPPQSCDPSYPTVCIPP